MSDEAELERLRQQRAAQLREQASSDVDAEAMHRQQQEQAEAQKEAILRQILSTEARERLQRVRIARPDQAQVLERQLISLASSGRLRGTLDDRDLKQLLARLFPPQRDINIRRKGSIE